MFEKDEIWEQGNGEIALCDFTGCESYLSVITIAFYN